MNWEVAISAAVPVLTGVAMMLYKLGSIDTKLAFLQKAVDNLVIRMDRVEKTLYKRKYKHKKP
jgi:hypothetical protein